MKIAILDLGTNVFNLLIVEFNSGDYKFLTEFKVPARLGAGGGLLKGEITPQAVENAHQAMQSIVDEIKKNGGVEEIYAYATSAVREAKNGIAFVKGIKDKFGIDINVINGIKEAEYIFYGVISSIRKEIKEQIIPYDSKILSMDIGGGSVEFIISTTTNILWKESFPIGMARMREMFPYKEPITIEVQSEFISYCNNLLTPLWEMIDIYKPSIFIGSSGSFETFKDLMFNCGYKDLPSIEFNRDKLNELNNFLVNSTTQERMCLKGMSAIRVDFIVLASIFTQYVINKLSPSRIYQSAYSLKEGVAKLLFDEYEK